MEDVPVDDAPLTVFQHYFEGLMAVVGWVGAIDDSFLLNSRSKRWWTHLAFDAAGLVKTFTFMTVGLGILLAIARFHC